MVHIGARSLYANVRAVKVAVTGARKGETATSAKVAVPLLAQRDVTKVDEGIPKILCWLSEPYEYRNSLALSSAKRQIAKVLALRREMVEGNGGQGTDPDTVHPPYVQPHDPDGIEPGYDYRLSARYLQAENLGSS